MQRVTLIGRDHTWSPSMTDMQRERSEAPLERAEYPVAPYELWGLLAIFLVAVPAIVGLWWLS